MSCTPVVDPACNPVEFIVIDSVAKVLDEISKQMAASAAWAVKTLVTGWIAVPSPLLTKQNVVTDLRTYTYWAVAAIAVGSLLFAAGRLVWERNGQAAADTVKGLVQLVLVTATLLPALVIVAGIGDSYSVWIIDKATGGELGERLVQLTGALSTVATPGATSIIIIMISLMLLLVAIGQILMSIAVAGLKLLLIGVAPVMAASSIHNGGRGLARPMTWLAATVLYKPTAATIYAVAFWMIQDRSFTTVLTGMVMMCMAIVALPALVRLLSPIAAQVAGSGSAGAALGAALGGAATMASGAIELGSSVGGSKGSGSAPAPPTGSSAVPGGPASPAGPSSAGPSSAGSTAGVGDLAAAAGPAGAAVVGAEQGVEMVDELVEKTAAAGPTAVATIGGAAADVTGSGGQR